MNIKIHTPANRTSELIPNEYNEENYLPLIYSESRNKQKTSGLLKGTKNLILNTTKYNSYIRNYTTLTQTTTFKDPDVTSYPITKNKHILSLSVKKYNNEISASPTKSNKFHRTQDKRKSERRVTILKKKFSQNIEAKNTLDLYKLSSLENFAKCFEVEFDILNKIKEPNYFKEFVKERVNILVLGENENVTTRLYKSYNIGTNDEVELSLQSIRITLYNKDKSDNRELFIFIPFSLLPIFYYVKSDIFKIFLTKIISFEKAENGENNIIINNENLNEVLKTMKKILKTGGENPEKIKKENYIAFEWLTTTDIYNIVITMPIIEFTLTKRNQTFTKFIEKEFMLYLIQQNFVQWDTNLLNYLIRYKLFRENLHTPFQTEKLTIVLDRDQVLVESANSDSAVCGKRPKSNYLDFFVTDEKSITKYYKFKSYSIQVYVNLFDKNNKFSYPFNLSHMLNLEKLRKFIDLKDYLPKVLLISYKSQTVGLDTKYFENVEDRHIKFLIDINKEKTIDKNITYKIK
jgi:hypothetical protein